ncbi:FAD-dependent oxidoreductase [Roseococcus pinisoli]|uniref:GMC family oxidoreductase n=1 Tax=Roseococcus pinisoli TaxID=2835040 RepID=A0ABS5QDY4_9PROT|nr:FAD-dependent oxidoreductase [Roseococcus pinisoli]MBS7811742.1 GMC family oxidoreductase [Roseococcus pinisoli]
MIDDAEMVEDGARLECDLCIVGAGAAGIAIALQFLDTKRRIILLESGRPDFEARTQALYEGEVADPALHPPADSYRQRRFGGSTALWGGRCMPLDPVDLEARHWVPHSGWPIGMEELARWYRAANALCEAGEYQYSAARAVPGGMRSMIAGFDPENFSADGIERFSTPTNFASRYGHRLRASASVRVLLGANCTAIETDAGSGRVEALRVRTLSGRGFLVRAAQVVLALGGLETPRLLLASRLGNAQDQVGRYYMCHIAGTSGRLRLAVPRAMVHPGYERSEDGTYIRRRLQLNAAAQERHEVGNAVARLHFPRIPDPSHGSGVLSGLYLARRLLPYEYRKRLDHDGAGGVRHMLAHLGNVATDPGSAVGFATSMLFRRKLAARKFPSVIVHPPGRVFSLDFHAEQQPNPESRITLGATTDALGMPRLHIDWRHTAGDLRTAEVFFRLLAEDLRRWGRGWLEWDPAELAHDMLRDGAYGGHHIGTARMGRSPRDSVVDAEGRVHGISNLSIAGSATFPTSGQANPTLTIVALALRMAERLKQVG